MLTIRRFLSRVLPLFLVAALFAGCEMFSSQAWQRPSPLSGRPPPPPEKQEGTGGFAVLVEAPGQPSAARVMADVEAFAQGRGFMRQGGDPAVGDRWALGDIRLDVAYQTSDLRVVANLHSFSSKLNRKFVNGFYQDFHQQYAAGYGADTPMYENDYTDGEDGSFRGGGGSGGGSRGGGGR